MGGGSLNDPEKEELPVQCATLAMRDSQRFVNGIRFMTTVIYNCMI